jgi:GTPase
MISTTIPSVLQLPNANDSISTERVLKSVLRLFELIPLEIEQRDEDMLAITIVDISKMIAAIER